MNLIDSTRISVEWITDMKDVNIGLNDRYYEMFYTMWGIDLYTVEFLIQTLN